LLLVGNVWLSPSVSTVVLHLACIAVVAYLLMGYVMSR
jgi:hypothetical protein